MEQRPEPEMFEGLFLSQDVGTSGTFLCSLPLYNTMHDLAVQTLRSNIHAVIEDCPHREKCGWLGDVWMAAETWIMNLDLGTFNRKFIEDIRQTYAYGHPDLPADVAGGKRMHLNPGPMIDWMAATVILPWYHYVYTGDLPELRRHYPYMKRFVEAVVPLIKERYASGKLDLLRKERFFFGDWLDITLDGRRVDPSMVSFPSETPAMLSGTQTLIHALQNLIGAAEAVGADPDRDGYASAASELIDLANQHYFDASAASYGSQSANAWAWRLDMVPEASREAFRVRFGREIVEVDDSLQTTGQMGLAAIFPALTEAGHGELVYALSDKQGTRGIRAMIARGATTLWELQGHGDPVPGASGNHPALSGYDTWFYQYLCGIQPDPAFPGFKRTLLKPWFDPEVEWAKASHHSPYGTIRSEWKRQPDGTIEWNITVPPNTSAMAAAPEGMQFEDGTTGRELPGGSHTLRVASP
jgi:alpha-L-rhamnosidase